MRFPIDVFSALLILSFHCQAATLPPKVEADRQMLAASAALKAKDWPEAIRALEATEATGLKTLPEAFNYLYGMALNEVGKPADAARRLEAYIHRYGERGRYYREALEQLNRSDSTRLRMENEERLRQQALEKERVERESRLEEERQQKKNFDAAWRNASGRLWLVNGLVSYYDGCEVAEKQLRKHLSEYKSFSCSCETGPIPHPAHSDKDQTLCDISYRANLLENGVSSVGLDINRRDYSIKTEQK